MMCKHEFMTFTFGWVRHCSVCNLSQDAFGLEKQLIKAQSNISDNNVLIREISENEAKLEQQLATAKAKLAAEKKKNDILQHQSIGNKHIIELLRKEIDIINNKITKMYDAEALGMAYQNGLNNGAIKAREKVVELKQRAEQAEALIDKMKCCGNCAYTTCSHVSIKLCNKWQGVKQ